MTRGGIFRSRARDGAPARRRARSGAPDRKTFYIAASDSNRIGAWDVAIRKRLRLYNSGSDPERFAISPDGGTAHIANEDQRAV